MNWQNNGEKGAIVVKRQTSAPEPKKSHGFYREEAQRRQAIV